MFKISLTRRVAYKGLLAWLNLTAMHTLFRPFKTGIALLSFLLAVSLCAWGTAVAQAAERQALTSKPIKAKPNKKKKGPKVLVGKAFGHSAQVKALAAELAQQRGLPKAWVQQQIARARLLPQVQQMILPAPSPAAKNWGAYRARFLEPKRIQAGLAFWQAHADDLSRAEKTYGVPARYIVGILGVETYFGQHQGQFKVLDALVTLSLAFPSEHRQAEERRQFFKSELGYHLQQRFKDPSLTNPLGSYAGASGWPQFMPSSIAKFAVDFDQDGHVNLGKSAADAIGSVAHYFQAYGWQSGMPTHFEVNVQASESDLNALLAPDIVPSWSATHLSEKKIGLSEQGRQFTGSLALVELNNGGEPSSFVAGTDNFFVVTRYNRSSYYALAVIELGEAIDKAMSH